MRQRILEPLKLRSTTFAPKGDLAAWVTKGHDKGKVVAAWDATDAIAGAGGLRSNADDLLTYLTANVGPAHTPLERAMRESHVKRAAPVASALSSASTRTGESASSCSRIPPRGKCGSSSSGMASSLRR